MKSWESFYNYLPEVLQESSLLYIMAVCFSIGYIWRALPNKIFPNSLLQAAVLCAGITTAIFTISPIPRAMGMGIIYAALSMMSYDMILSFVETKIYAILGASPKPSKTTTLTQLPIETDLIEK